MVRRDDRTQLHGQLLHRHWVAVRDDVIVAAAAAAADDDNMDKSCMMSTQLTSLMTGLVLHQSAMVR